MLLGWVVSRPSPCPGTEGRYVQMTFPFSPLDYADWNYDGLPDISGAFIQYIRIKATGSDLWRDSFLGEGDEARLAYEALPEEQRGALVYQRQTAGGLLVEIQDDANQTAREKYQTLPEEKRGPILYYVKRFPASPRSKSGLGATTTRCSPKSAVVPRLNTVNWALPIWPPMGCTTRSGLPILGRQFTKRVRLGTI